MKREWTHFSSSIKSLLLTVPVPVPVYDWLTTYCFVENHIQSQKVTSPLDNPISAFELSCHGNNIQPHFQSPESQNKYIHGSTVTSSAISNAVHTTTQFKIKTTYQIRIQNINRMESMPIFRNHNSRFWIHRYSFTSSGIIT